jgi:hypothetical protein
MNKGIFIFAIVEILALALGIVLFYFGLVAWYIVRCFCSCRPVPPWSR